MRHASVGVLIFIALTNVPVSGGRPLLDVTPRLANFSSSGDALPSPRRAPSREPLGVPQPAPIAPGPYAFLNTQAGTADPVAYDPCRPLHYVVNSANMPPGAEGIVAEAVALVAQNTGLHFVFDGSADEPPTYSDRPPFQPDRYGDQWAPILIAWSSSTDIPELGSEAIGYGGSTSINTRDGVRVYVTGDILLDGPALAKAMTRPSRGPAYVRGVILHELAHVLGLDHVNDPRQLMHAASATVTDYQSGDLAGLSALGSGECVGLL